MFGEIALHNSRGKRNITLRRDLPHFHHPRQLCKRAQMRSVAGYIPHSQCCSLCWKFDTNTPIDFVVLNDDRNENLILFLIKFFKSCQKWWEIFSNRYIDECKVRRWNDESMITHRPFVCVDMAGKHNVHLGIHKPCFELNTHRFAFHIMMFIAIIPWRMEQNNEPWSLCSIHWS